MGFSEGITSFVDSVQCHWPDILSGISLTTGVASTIYGIAVTPKAMDRFLEWIMENTTEEDRRGLKLSELHKLIPFKMKAKLAWKLYLPVILGTVTSGSTGIASDVMHDRKEMAYAAIASAAQARLSDFVESTKEAVGPKKYDEIEASAAQKRIDRLPDDKNNVYYVNKRTEGFPVIDNVTSRVYVVDRDELDRIEMRLNNRLVLDEVSLNDVYREFGDIILLPKIGENLVYPSGTKLTFVEDMWPGFWNGRPAVTINLARNLCVKHGRDYIVLNRYA